MSIFKDFIPAGEDTGAQGEGFKDFVTPKVPEVVGAENVVVKNPDGTKYVTAKEQPKKKKAK